MSQCKSLTKEEYLKTFSRAVRWRLPPQDAEEAIADYRELIFREGRDETKLVEDLGSPVQAAGMLTDVKTYHRWQKVFAVLAFGLLLLVKWSWTGLVHLRLNNGEEYWYPVLVMAVGFPLSLYWFRRHGQKNGLFPKLLLLALAIVLIVGGGVTYGIWNESGGYGFFEELSATRIGLRPEALQLVTAMMYAGTCSALAALAGLVLARCRDRRWLALYVLGVTAAAIISYVTLSLFTLHWILPGSELQTYLFARIFPIGAVGLIGTAVALC